jgi:hypothetical protein
MESIYFVMSWLCHRSCKHCYESRFHPYHGEEAERLVRQAEQNVPCIIDHLPARMTYLDWKNPDADGRIVERRGRIIVAGGEIMLDAVRATVLYPALKQIKRKYRDAGGVDVIVQTTGDILTEQHVVELKEHEVDVISCAGMDAYHAGFESEAARQRLRDKLTGWFERHGFNEAPREARVPGLRYYHFFGAEPGSWIGKLWPRGRAWENSLTTATLQDNFCNGWSGGLDFLNHRHSGSEVSIDPEGNVFPCCLKTKGPVGNLLQDKLEAILERAAGNPVYEAISMGHPERMGITHGWSVDTFLEKSRRTLPDGRVYQNLCIGCDAFHDEVLLARPAGWVPLGEVARRS